MTFPAPIDLSTILLATSESCTLSVVLSRHTISPVLASIAKCIFRYPLLLEYLLSSHEPDLQTLTPVESRTMTTGPSTLLGLYLTKSSPSKTILLLIHE
jgi:hypothetical protein